MMQIFAPRETILSNDLKDWNRIDPANDWTKVAPSDREVMQLAQKTILVALGGGSDAPALYWREGQWETPEPLKFKARLLSAHARLAGGSQGGNYWSKVNL